MKAKYKVGDIVKTEFMPVALKIISCIRFVDNRTQKVSYFYKTRVADEMTIKEDDLTK